jgi:hypothetical protein
MADERPPLRALPPPAPRRPVFRRAPGPAEIRPSAMAMPVVEPMPAFAFAATLAALLGFALFQALAWWQAGFAFEYPLDDVYIHLAVSEEIARRGYGVNIGEYTSAASSPIYPFLLAPFAPTALHRYVPLAINIVALAGAAWLWGRFLILAGLAETGVRGVGWAFALLGPILLNMVGVAFTGMEHGLHLLLTVALMAGLMRFFDDGRVGALLILGIALAPMVRIEALALSGLAAAILLISGRIVASLVAGLAALGSVAVFVWFLLSLGLEPLPNSVMSKIGVSGDGSIGHARAALIRFVYNVATTPHAKMLAGLAAFWFLALFADRRLRRGPPLLVLLAVVLAILAQLAFGRVGFVNRYEIYLVVFTTGMSAALALPWMTGRLGGLARFGTVMLMAGFGGIYLPASIVDGPQSSAAIRFQQAQMGRFVRDYVQAPVAVNDLGWVSYRNDRYVLDLWGLASREALEIRFFRPSPGWAGPLAAAKGVGLAMIYDSWLAVDDPHLRSVSAVPPGWVRLGDLVLTVPEGYAGDAAVAFYATSEAVAADLREKLRAFAPTLPKGAEFRFVAPP